VNGVGERRWVWEELVQFWLLEEGCFLVLRVMDASSEYVCMFVLHDLYGLCVYSCTQCTESRFSCTWCVEHNVCTNNREVCNSDALVTGRRVSKRFITFCSVLGDCDEAYNVQIVTSIEVISGNVSPKFAKYCPRSSRAILKWFLTGWLSGWWILRIRERHVTWFWPITCVEV